MAQRTDIFDLGTLGLHSGEGRSIDLNVPVEPFELAGQRYAAAGDGTAARIRRPEPPRDPPSL